MKMRSRRGLPAMLLLVLAACPGDGPTDRTVPVASVRVTAPADSLHAGAQLQLSAAALDADGASLPDRAVTWSSSSDAVATVSATGMVTGVAPGNVTITASAGGKFGTLGLRVAQVPVASIAVTPAADTTQFGAPVQLTATVRDAGGTVLAGRTVTWSTSDPTRVQVSNTGLATPVAEGEATITATSEGKSATSRITVAPVPVASVTLAPDSADLVPGGTQQLTLVARDAAGNALVGRVATLSTSSTAVATIDANRVVTAVGEGRATITANVEGVTAQTVIVVRPAPVASVTLAPDSVELFPGGQQQLTLVARDAAGNALVGRAATLSTSSTAVATIDANRVVTAVGEGKATITATVEGKTAQTVIVVRPPPVASVTLAPDSVNLFTGEQQQLTLVARDAAGNALVGRAATLSTSNTAVATIDANRVVTAVGEGKATITATVEGKTAQTVVVVRPVPVASVAFVPDSADLIVGGQTQLALVARDAAGNVLAGRAATLTTDNPGVATINADRVVTAVGEGRATIIATVEGKTETAVVRVRPVPIATLSIEPDSSRIEVGRTVTLTVVARDAAGSALPRSVTLTTSDASVAAFSAPNVVMGMAPGTATITASAEGKTATARVVVIYIPVATVEVSPAEVVIFAGGMQDLTATARSADGDVLTGRAVQWSTSNPGVASVSSSGVVSGVSAGSARITATVEGKTDEVPVTVRTPGQDVTNAEITFFDVDPSAVDVTNGPGTFTFTFRARDFGSGVSNVFVSLNYPGNATFAPSCAGTRVSGNQYDGTYTCTITFPQNSPSRTWTVSYLSVQDVVGNYVQLPTHEVAARGWPTQVTVSGAVSDVQAPEVTGFSFTPQTVDVASGPASVVFTLNGRDLGGTGITSVYVSLTYPNNPGATMPCSSSDPVSGTRTEGVWQCTVTFPHNSTSRTWTVDYVSMTDAVGNTGRLFSHELSARGWATQVNVTGGNPDTQVPALTGFAFTPHTVNVASGPASVEFTINAQDAGGISGVYVSLTFPNNPGPTNPCSANDPTSGTRTSGVWKCTVTFPQNSPTRTWDVYYISITDLAGNTYRPFQHDLQSLGYHTTVQVTN